jgi:molecular chaperone DnaK (HSP70)
MTFNKKFASIAGGFLLVLSLVASGFVIEDRYNNQTDHEKDIKYQEQLTELKFEKFEEQIVMNLEQFQKSSDYKYYSQILEDIDAQLYKIRQWLRQHPDDLEAREDYQNLLEKRKKVKEKLDSLMEIN